jgi:hypothetical protein
MTTVTSNDSPSYTVSLLPIKTEWLRATATGPLIGVDRDKNVIRGYIVAQEGPFKTEDRGEFDQQSLKTVVRLMNAKPGGLKSRFAHPTLSGDGLGTFLGRARNARLDGDRVRADLHLDPTSFDTPNGDLGGYVMRLADSDPDAFASSLVLKSDKRYRNDARGRRARDDEGKELPPLWRPTILHASDVVDGGEAVDGFLSADGLPDAVVRRGAELLDQQFAGQPREVVEARCMEWLSRYLELRFGPVQIEEISADRDPRLRRHRRRLEEIRRAATQTLDLYDFTDCDASVLTRRRPSS